jgi:hypothetical protein
MSTTIPRRIVTGHDNSGAAVIAMNEEARTFPINSLPGLLFHEIWATEEMPARIDNGPDAVADSLQLRPPRNGTVIRVLDIPPDAEHDAADSAAHFAEMGAFDAGTSTEASPHPNMHRTETVDYGILIEGELWLVLDKGEVKLRPGDVVVQRGTNHAWSNRSDRNARIAFILIDGKFSL